MKTDIMWPYFGDVFCLEINFEAKMIFKSHGKFKGNTNNKIVISETIESEFLKKICMLSRYSQAGWKFVIKFSGSYVLFYSSC